MCPHPRTTASLNRHWYVRGRGRLGHLEARSTHLRTLPQVSAPWNLPHGRDTPHPTGSVLRCSHTSRARGGRRPLGASVGRGFPTRRLARPGSTPHPRPHSPTLVHGHTRDGTQAQERRARGSTRAQPSPGHPRPPRGAEAPAVPTAHTRTHTRGHTHPLALSTPRHGSE